MNATVHAAVLVAAAFLLLASIGCSSTTYGTKIDPLKVQQIEKGKSTRIDVERLLGPTQQPAIASDDGSRHLMYQVPGVEYQRSVVAAADSLFTTRAGVVSRMRWLRQ